MRGRAFVDTNVLVYAHDPSAGEKHVVARELVERLWESRAGVLSTQVLQEFHVNVRRKSTRPMTAQEARRALTDYLCWEVVVNTGNSVLEAIEIEERHGLSFWDALIVQAALSAGVETLYSEDLADGRSYSSVRVSNPFKLARSKA
jgi:predicted nucleic acid-binding protein